MSLSDPFNTVKSVVVGQQVPGGNCDGLYVTVAGNVAFTTINGDAVAAFAVATVPTVIPIRVKSVDSGTTATVLAGYH